MHKEVISLLGLTGVCCIVQLFRTHQSGLAYSCSSISQVVKNQKNALSEVENSKSWS